MNVGKKFEKCFKDSIPDFCLKYRLKDPPQAQNHTSNSVFSWNNPCDFFMFDTHNREFWCLELKSTKQRYITFEDINSNKIQSKMIKKHQILDLKKFSNYDYVNSGFIFNFREDADNIQRSYYQDINSFLKMCNNINKSSFNEIDLIMNGAIKIIGDKLRVNYRWNIGQLIIDVLDKKV